jgi:hypothetical protein
MEKNTTILIRNVTRDKLKRIGRKDQTYDELINQLINNQDLVELKLMSSNQMNSAIQGS